MVAEDIAMPFKSQAQLEAEVEAVRQQSLSVGMELPEASIGCARTVLEVMYSHKPADFLTLQWLLRNHRTHHLNRTFDYLEVGAARGGSALCADMFLHPASIICIDPFVCGPDGQPKADFDISVSKIKTPLTLIRETSDSACGKIPDTSVDVLLIDGWHEYDQVYRDIKNYWPKLRGDGLLILHDCDWYTVPETGEGHWGIVRAVFELLANKRVVKHAGSAYATVTKYHDAEELDEIVLDSNTFAGL